MGPLPAIIHAHHFSMMSNNKNHTLLACLLMSWFEF